jgi:hypothetical protein
MFDLPEQERTVYHSDEQCGATNGTGEFARLESGQFPDGLLYQFILGLKPVIQVMAGLTTVGEINLICPFRNLRVSKLWCIHNSLCIGINFG